MSREPLVAESWLTLQHDCQNGFTMGVPRYLYPSDNPGSAQKMYIFFWPNVMKFRKFIKIIYHIKLADLSK